MAKNTNANTDVAQVKKQNAQAKNGKSSSEFASETDAQQVRQQNQKSQQKKQ
ncbi:gamma-type small acid-soluble spore protein [Sporolactobacillus terrae]|uniref:Small, acid-soluble spore protein gamma-type n=1 Tax=Sporolactobacillus terrae TaxID=269673 RepID=A0A410DAT7_9BACL|nr:gamma-type small acid-soluble spore protein [Sporolactobacillus terrae]QAA23237.1 gamma-type small acid-soluble spore protein [Sporolactobacillus terrae]QAA26207.1 gamma-type small acid-soluble spore protein [Sporolactobacillus terrae]UAK15304.1 gamma-type small acid-soluble spore protein [Sporolactobacillus terrae]BBN99642.1 hypothetical protein St703_23470 [Sporolactobacillus terrae]